MLSLCLFPVSCSAAVSWEQDALVGVVSQQRCHLLSPLPHVVVSPWHAEKAQRPMFRCTFSIYCTAVASYCINDTDNTGDCFALGPERGNNGSCLPYSMGATEDRLKPMLQTFGIVLSLRWETDTDQINPAVPMAPKIPNLPSCCLKLWFIINIPKTKKLDALLRCYVQTKLCVITDVITVTCDYWFI